MKKKTIANRLLIKYNLHIISAAIRKRIAAFFYSTQFRITYDKRTKYEKTIKDSGAADLHRLHFFFVVKGHYIAFYRSRAPPSVLENPLTIFQDRRIHNDY